MRGFDRLARVYRLLEYAAFGRTLLRARLAFVERLEHCERILVLGEGDGRFLQALVAVAPSARIRSVDASGAMIRIAERRLGEAGRARVVFEHADALRLDLGPDTYDAVVSLFFLDCFTPDQVAGLVERISRQVRPGGLWLFADFAIPDRGAARWHARLVVGALYRFFRWQTGLAARALPPSEAALGQAGFACDAAQTFRAGLVRSAVYVRRTR